MKQRNLYTILAFAAFLTILIVLRFFYARQNQKELCRDTGILSQFSDNPEAAEFVFLNHYYCLPCPLSEFIENGFSPADEANLSILEESRLKTGEYQHVRLDFGAASSLGLIVYQPDQTSVSLKDALVYSAELTVSFQDRDSLPSDCFVTKYGITGQTGRKTIRKLFLNDAFYRKDDFYHYLNADHPDYNEMRYDSEFPTAPLFYLKYKDTTPEGWNRIRLSHAGYAFHVQGLYNSFEYDHNSNKTTLPVCILTSADMFPAADFTANIRTYAKSLGTKEPFQITDLLCTTLPDNPDSKNTNLRTIYEVTESSGFRYHIFENRSINSSGVSRDRKYSFPDLLFNDRRDRLLQFCFMQYPGKKDLIVIEKPEAYFTSLSVSAFYRNRAELMAAADEITAFFEYLKLQTDYAYSAFIRYNDPFVRKYGCQLITLADTELNTYLDEDLYEKSLQNYLAFCLAFRRTELYDEFTQAEIEAAKSAYEAPHSDLQDFYAAPDSGYSLPAVYEIAEKLGYSPKGTPEHFIFTGINSEGKPVIVELSYDFIRTADNELQGGYEGYYFIDQEEHLYYQNFCLSFHVLKEIFPVLREE